MKKILFLVLVSVYATGQSTLITPNGDSNTIITKDGKGLDHRSPNGLIGVGTYANNDNGAYIQTHTNHPLNFTTNNGLSQMTLTTTGRLGIGMPLPTAQLDVVRGTAPDGTAIFRGTIHVSHFNYSTNEHTYIRGGKAGSNVIINDVLGLGNVGIGIGTPLAKLHISQGNLRVDAFAGNGNVSLFADNQGTVFAALPVAFSAYNPYVTSATIPSGVATIFPFSTELYDLGGFFDNSTYEFAAPVNGIYHFDAFVTFDGVGTTVSNASYILSFYKNNLSYFTITEPLFVGSSKTLNFSQDIKLSAGEKVKILVAQTSGGSLSISGSTSSNFTGRLVSRL